MNDTQKKRKGKNIPDIELEVLQSQIEDLTFQFKDESIFKETSNLIKLLIDKDLINAKFYLYKNLPTDMYNNIITHFGEYTLEAIIIHVLGVAFNSLQETSIIRVSIDILGLLDFKFELAYYMHLTLVKPFKSILTKKYLKKQKIKKEDLKVKNI